MWAWEVCEIIEQGLRAGGLHAQFHLIPLADGGEGTARVVGRLTGAEFRKVVVTGPLGDPLEAEYAIDRAHARAILDMASAAGLPLVPPHLRNPMNTTTHGVGELILDAINQGVREIIVGVGGSATVDGGIGCLAALGAGLRDATGSTVSRAFGRDLARIDSVDLSGCRDRISGVQLTVAADVQNPLLGPIGAAFVYGPQKGAHPDEVQQLERGMAHWAHLVELETGKRFSDQPGMGASGGLAFGLAAIGATVVPGAALVIRLAKLEQHIQSADLVITGEGMLDARTFYGKVPLEVLKVCLHASKPCIMIAGKVEAIQPWLDAGATAVVPVLHGLCAEPDTRHEAHTLLYETALWVARLLGTAAFQSQGGTTGEGHF